MQSAPINVNAVLDGVRFRGLPAMVLICSIVMLSNAWGQISIF